MRLDEHTRDKLIDALRDAFRGHESFELVLERLGENSSIVSSPNKQIKNIINATIQYMEEREKIPEFLLAARKENPHNQKLREFVAGYSIVASTFSDDEYRTRTPEKQQIIPGVWRSRLAELERWVCSIEIPLQNDPGKAHRGTGFLVGEDLILTNYHVVESLFNPEERARAGEDWARPEDAIVRFDFALVKGEQILREGAECGFAQGEWCEAYSKDSRMDRLPYPPKPPDEDELDYAFVKLNRRVGAEPVSDLPGAPARGWYKLPEKFYNFTIGDMVLIPHYPKGGFLRMSMEKDYILKYLNENNTRMVYRASTEPGSSGAPCFDLRWNFMGIHRGDRSDLHGEYKEGVPFNAILNLNQRKKPPPGSIVLEEIPVKIRGTLAFIRGNYRYNQVFFVLYEQVADKGSAEQIDTLANWLADIAPFLTAEWSSQYVWQILCLDQYIQLTGADGMTEFFKNAFNQHPAGKCDAPIFLRLAAEQVSHLVDTISTRSESLVKARDLVRFDKVVETTLNDIDILENELAGIKLRLEMFNCLTSEDGEPLPQDEIDDSLRYLKAQLIGSFDKSTPDEIPIVVRSEINSQIRQLKRKSPEYRNWISDLAARIESTKNMRFSLN